jgi:hypothetical protein
MNEQQQGNIQQQQVNPRGNQLPIAARPQQRARQRERNINAASQYSSNEIQGILRAIEAILPVHGEEWEEVAQIHAQHFPTMQRTSDSIKRKFQALYRSKKPTGDPFCPPEVRKAKQLRHDIVTKSEISSAEGNDDDRDGSFVDDPDDVIAPILNSEDEEEPQHRDIARNEPTNRTPRQDQPVNLPDTISSIVSSRRSTNSSGKKGKEDLIEIFTMKMLQRETDRADDDVRYKREREERAEEMRLMREEEERRRRHEYQMKQEELAMRREEMKVAAEARREEMKMFMMMMMQGKGDK